MSDGSSIGLTADQSLRAIFGDRDVLPEQGMRPAHMAEYLESAPDDPGTYDDTSRWIGKQVMHFLKAHPESFKVSNLNDLFDAVFPHATESFSETYPQLTGITGFMVGWGCNAARYAFGHNEMPNPAVMTISVSDAEE